MQTYDITNGTTQPARAAIENAIRQHSFYLNLQAFGPSFCPNDRENKTRTFKEVNPPFLLQTNFGTVEVFTSYKETKRELKYEFKVFENQQQIKNPITYLKQFIK